MTIHGISGNTKQFYDWKVGQINVQSCSDDHRIHFALQECVRANLDIICFQEVRLLKSGSIEHAGYTFFWKGLNRLRRHGVGIAIRKNSNIIVEGIIYSSARAIAADISVKGCKIRMISCYAPTLNSPQSTKQSFYKELSKLSKLENHRKLLIMGDFNAEPLFCRRHARYDGSRPLEEESNYTNENVMHFLNFCRDHRLSILNSWFDHALHHRITWHAPNGILKRVYDYSLSESWIRQYVKDVRVRNSYFNSDHRLVVTKLRTPANKAARRFKRKLKVIKPNLELLNDNNILGNMSQAIHSHLRDNSSPHPQSLNEMHNHIIQALEKGKERIPEKRKITREAIPWEQDTELNQLHQSRLNLRKQCISPQIKLEIRNTTKKIKKRVKEIQNRELKDKGKEITDAKQQRHMEKMWKFAKSHGESSMKKARPIQCPGLAQHFRNHFNPDQSSLTTPTELQNIPEYITILRNSNTEITNIPPNEEEILEAINQLNKGKSTLDIESEIIKAATTVQLLKDELVKYYDQVWTTKQCPDQWTLSKTIAIWKNKGNAMDCTKYRGLSIGSTLCKIGMKIIIKRISKFYESQLKRTQFGFRKGMGCNDGLYMMKQLQDIATLSQRRLYVCFIDLTAAFDHVNRDLLFQTIRSRLHSGQDTTNIDIIEHLYKSTKSYMQNSDPESSFPTSSGVRQGGLEGPPLFNLFSDFVLRVYEERKTTAGVIGLSIPYNIPSAATNRTQRQHAPSSGVCDDDECAYADDLGLVAWNQSDLQLCINIIGTVFTEFGLSINITKTETLIFNWQNTTDETYPESIATINNIKIKNMQNFKYLGVWLNNDSLHIGKKELDHRLCSAHNAFAEHKKLLTNFNIKLETRIMFLNAFVRSRMTYGCHVWRPTQQESNKLDSTYRYFLRCMVRNGHTRVNPPRQRDDQSTSEGSSSEDDMEVDWRYVMTNEDLMSITQTESVIQFHKKQQLQWISHLIRRENNNICKILTFHSVKRTKPGRKNASFLERAVQHSDTSLNQFLENSMAKANVIR